jgi:hypothetical protein
LPTNTSGDSSDPLTASLTGAPADPDLARIIDAWSALPDHIKAAVLALVQTAR